MCVGQIIQFLVTPMALVLIAWFFTRRFYMNQRTQEFWNRLQDINKMVIQ